MPPKKPVADSTVPPKEKKTGARKPPAHPSTAIMVKEALEALDSRKGASSIAIQNYIKGKYPSVDESRLKNLVRKTLKKGIETGTLVRPANSSVVVGALGKFKLAAKEKEAKPESENAEPNVQKVPKAAKSTKKSPKADAKKKKNGAEEQNKSQEDSNPPKKLKEKDAPAKKPKGKTKTTEKEDEGASAKPKATKETKAASQTRESRKASATNRTGRGASKTAA